MSSPQSADDPPADNPEATYRSLLAIDIRSAIGSASIPRLRAALSGTIAHMCQRARPQLSEFRIVAPGSRRKASASEKGSGMRAGFQLYDQVSRAVIASWLTAMQVDAERASADPEYYGAVMAPLAATASSQRMRGLLLTLADCIDADIADADTSAALAATQFPDDVWEAGIGVGFAIALYRHVVLIQAVHAVYYVHEGLGIGDATVLARFTVPPPGTSCYTASPN